MPTTDNGTPYNPVTALDGSDVATALNFFTSAALANSVPHYSSQFWLLDDNDGFVEDITPYVRTDGTGGQVPTVKMDCTQDGVQATLSFTYRRPSELQWGRARVKAFLLAQSDDVASGQWYRFPCGVYIVTSPQRDLQDGTSRSVTGYDKTSLLMSEQTKSMSWGPADFYKTAVEQCFINAGVLPVGGDLRTIADLSSGWSDKQIPSGQFRTYALSDQSQSWLSIINALLKDSGQDNLYVNPDGRYQIQDLPTPADDSYDWVWVADKDAQNAITQGDYRAKITRRMGRQYNGDVYNQPNQFRFTQTGLTFLPTHTDGSDGLYVVDNMTTPPSDQNSVGRVIVHNEFLDASGSADLIAQGNSYVTRALSAIETISLQTAPWRVGWHYDVFLYADSNLPGQFKTRRLQAQGWTLPLTGAAMEWETNVVSLL